MKSRNGSVPTGSTDVVHNGEDRVWVFAKEESSGMPGRRVAIMRRQQAIHPLGQLRILDPRGRPMYWIGPAGEGQDAGPGTDFDAVRRGYVSITPIHVDLTRYQALEQIAGWVAEISTDREVRGSVA